MSRDLNTSRTEALRGLLRSLGYADNDSPSPSTGQLQKLSEKISEILGDVQDHSLKPGDQPSQLLNEDGLPIIDISEPVDEDTQASTSSPVSEQDFIPLSLLPSAERERRRRERDRILDLLEEEERLEQLQVERDAEEERKEAIRRRKETAKAELQQLRAGRELQKKMGQALVRHAKGTRDDVQVDADSISQAAPTVAKKCVSFADVKVVEADKEMPTHQPELGGVTLGRLRAQSRVSLASAAEAQKHPMKMRVVERHTVATPAFSYSDPDSDDESTSSAPHLSPRSENDPLDEEDKSSDTLSDDALSEQGFDYDMAQHHREIALEYHKKRRAIGAEATKAMAVHVPDDDDQEIPKGQTPVSRFRADRMTAAYDKSHGSVSMSIGPNVIPASRQKSLQNSVRVGKLENGQLVGESGSEDETVREVIEMLRTGNIQNVGPDVSLSSIAPFGNADVVESQPTSTVAHGAKPSKLKLAHAEDRINGDNVRSHPTASNVVERKAPSSSPKQHFPVNKPPLRPRGTLPPMIIDSPSFPMTPTSLSSPTLVTTSSPSLHKKRPVSKIVAERQKLAE